MRLPPRPDLTWKEDGTPVDERVGDVYYSAEDGLAESRAVFLAGCGLPEAWQGRTQYTIAELGFGTGLNFLATWQMWRAHGPQTGWLNFVSFEGFPLDAEDVERALKPWSELSDLAEKLCAKWPSRAKGVRQLVWPDERISLTLHVGLIEETLTQAVFQADAWFLDGFSPAKNEAMWDEALWPRIAKRSGPGARAATFTVAGAVRRGLSENGFAVEKRPGHGRKRERLEAVFQLPATRSTPAPVSPVSNPRVAVIGAGIAGACLACTLKNRGAEVHVFDKADGPAQGTSGNPLALMMPRLDAGDTAHARLLIDAYLAAQAFYSGLPGTAETETVQQPRDAQEAERFEKLLADPPLGLKQLEAIRGGGLLHKKSVILRPAELLLALLKPFNVSWTHTPKIDFDQRAVDGTGYDAIVLATGWQMGGILPRLDLINRLGQVEWFESETSAPPQAQVRGHYGLSLQNQRLWGATYEDHAGGEPQVSETARDQNRYALASLAPYWRQDALRSDVHSRAGVRAATADQMPIIGAAPDVDALRADRQKLERQAWAIAPDAYAIPGVYIAGGYGSRGFTWGPWAASILTATLFDDPMPARLEALKTIVPNRQILRKLKRGDV